MTDKPQVQLPEENQTRRFVQLIIDGEDYLRVGNSAKDFHAQIMRRVLTWEFEIPFEQERVGMNDFVPARKGERYQAIRMGLIENSPERVFISGNSTDYDMGLNREQIERLKQRGLITKEVIYL